MFIFFSGPHVGRPTVGTKCFDTASNSLLSDGPIGYISIDHLGPIGYISIDHLVVNKVLYHIFHIFLPFSLQITLDR